MDFVKVTEQESHYRQLEKMPVIEILTSINKEDKTVAFAVEKAIPQIEKLIEAISDKMLAGGRLFYIGAGTSGRLAIVDASECTPTFGIPHGLVIALIAGGEEAITQPVEFAEDSKENGWKDLEKHCVSDKDIAVGITASGATPYVLGAVEQCQKRNIVTGCIVCNYKSPLAAIARYPVEVVVGPEFITGSTRMKCGTAEKLVLNMISTAVMIKLGRVEGNKMVNMQLSNEKLLGRGIRMVMEQLKLQDEDAARKLLLQHGSVKKAVEASRQKLNV